MKLSIQSDREIIKVVIADDQLTIRKSLEWQLSKVADIEVVAIAQNGIEALEKIADLDPDVIIIDLEMPYMDGITAIKEICDSFSNTKSLVFSTHEERDYINRAIIAGAKGYLLKSTSAEDLVKAIRNVYRGYFQLGSGLLDKISEATSQVVLDNTKLDNISDFDLEENSEFESESAQKVDSLVQMKRIDRHQDSIEDQIQSIMIKQGKIQTRFQKIEFKFNLLLCWQLIITLIILLNI